MLSDPSALMTSSLHSKIGVLFSRTLNYFNLILKQFTIQSRNGISMKWEADFKDSDEEQRLLKRHKHTKSKPGQFHHCKQHKEVKGHNIDDDTDDDEPVSGETFN